MVEYNCKISLPDSKTVEKRYTATSVQSLKKRIAEEGNFLINAKKESESYSLSSFKKDKLKTKDFYSFNHELLALLRAGIPVVLAFNGIIEKLEKKSVLSETLLKIRDLISEGESISDAFRKYEGFFPPLYIAILKSGEASGNIPDAIEEYLEYFERARLIRQKIKAASVYPAILTICSIFVVIFLLVFVVPVITSSFFEAGSQLPFLTQLILNISEFLKNYYWGILIGFGAVFWGGAYYFKTEKGRFLFDIFILKLPFIGELLIIYATALFSSSLSTILKGGVPLNTAMATASGLIQNRLLYSGMKNASAKIEKGAAFAAALKEETMLPGMALRMIAAGEEAGNLEKVLKDVARFYEKEIEAKLSIVASTIEPLLMVLMGFVIGFIMLAMYMPIFQMAGTVG